MSRGAVDLLTDTLRVVRLKGALFSKADLC